MTRHIRLTERLAAGASDLSRVDHIRSIADSIERSLSDQTLRYDGVDRRIYDISQVLPDVWLFLGTDQVLSVRGSFGKVSGHKALIVRIDRPQSGDLRKEPHAFFENQLTQIITRQTLYHEIAHWVQEKSGRNPGRSTYRDTTDYANEWTPEDYMSYHRDAGEIDSFFMQVLTHVWDYFQKVVEHYRGRMSRAEIRQRLFGNTAKEFLNGTLLKNQGWREIWHQVPTDVKRRWYGRATKFFDAMVAEEAQ